MVLGYGLAAPCVLQIRNINVKGLATLFDSKAQHHQACAGNQMMLMNCCLLCMSLGWCDSFQNSSNLVSWAEYPNIGWCTACTSTVCCSFIKSRSSMYAPTPLCYRNHISLSGEDQNIYFQTSKLSSSSKLKSYCSHFSFFTQDSPLRSLSSLQLSFHYVGRTVKLV